jgi:anti-anti-sigma regulatory factor
MLKITTKTDPGRTTLELEGKLAGAWVNELERCWREIRPGEAVRISLEAVTFIDDAGKKLLVKLNQGGAELKAAGCLTKCIVEEVIRESSRRGGGNERGE